MQSDGILIVFFSARFQRTRGCNYGIPKLSQNKMKRLYRIKEDEIMKAINLLKKNKAPGLDNITNELIIAERKSLV